MTNVRTTLVLSSLLAMSFLGVGRDLWTPDEPREAEISREMWLQPRVVPSLNGEAFIEKPPFYYWTVATVFAALGEPSAAAARSVSNAASFLTLVLVFLWGRRDFSAGVGLAAALALATSAQFMISSHWIVMDPLLMLFTTAALWAGSELVQGRGTRSTLLALYGALVLALCTKGLIGPALVAAGLLAYAAAQRSLAPIKSLRPLAGIAALLVTTAALAALIGAESGAGAVREWLWVNHVGRFFAPTDETGHAQPFYFYFSALPTAVFPWWLPLAALFRPSSWRPGPTPASGHATKVYLAALSVGMTLLLSASATKRGLYLLPLLPPLFLLLAATAAEWWARQSGPLRGAAWWLQIGCVIAFAAGPAAGALGYLRTIDPLTVTFLAVVGVLAAALMRFSRRGDRARTLATLGASAAAIVVGLLVITAPLAAPLKDMTPFIAWVGEQTRSERSIVVLGDVDETLNGIVPFVTGRAAVTFNPSEVDSRKPRYVLVQTKKGSTAKPFTNAAYERLGDRVLGQDRYVALWSRRDMRLSDATAPAAPVAY